MDQKLKYTIMLFYSNINQVSLKTRIMINNFIDTHHYPIKITIHEVDYDQDKNLTQQYGIMGTPAIIFMENGNLVRRLFGEVTSDEFRNVIEGIYNLRK
ncbi:thioredoxin family protein [Calditrichota bacterium]